MRNKSTYGAPRETRTPDPLITNQVLYQLSYKGTTTQELAQTHKKENRKLLVFVHIFKKLIPQIIKSSFLLFFTATFYIISTLPLHRSR